MAAAFLVLLSLLTPLLEPLPHGFMESPAFLPLFTPRGLPPGTYRTYTSRHDLDTVVAALRRDRSVASGREGLAVHSLIASDAFGQSGGYNRWKLALLYGARRARIARAARVADGRPVEAWTLISPYPDAQLEHLNPGTLLIVLRLTP